MFGVSVEWEYPLTETLAGCTIRDHAVKAVRENSGCGVRVGARPACMAAAEAGNVFARNAGGDVLRPSLGTVGKGPSLR